MPSLSNILAFLKDSIPAAILGVLYIFKREKDVAEAKETLNELKLNEITDAKKIDDLHSGELPEHIISEFLSDKGESKPVSKSE